MKTKLFIHETPGIGSNNRKEFVLFVAILKLYISDSHCLKRLNVVEAALEIELRDTYMLRTASTQKYRLSFAICLKERTHPSETFT